MANFLLALARRWTLFGRALVRLVTKHPPATGNDRSAASRARFWTELREGQREAEAHSQKPRA